MPRWMPRLPRRIKVGQCYCYEPTLFDIANPPPGRPKRGDVVCVTRLQGAPAPGTMGQVHVTDRKGNLLGLVFINSLQPWVGKNGCIGWNGTRSDA